MNYFQEDARHRIVSFIHASVYIIVIPHYLNTYILRQATPIPLLAYFPPYHLPLSNILCQFLIWFIFHLQSLLEHKLHEEFHVLFPAKSTLTVAVDHHL